MNLESDRKVSKKRPERKREGGAVVTALRVKRSRSKSQKTEVEENDQRKDTQGEAGYDSLDDPSKAVAIVAQSKKSGKVCEEGGNVGRLEGCYRGRRKEGAELFYLTRAKGAAVIHEEIHCQQLYSR